MAILASSTPPISKIVFFCQTLEYSFRESSLKNLKKLFDILFGMHYSGCKL